MDEEIKLDPTANLSDDSQAATPVTSTDDVENTEEVVKDEDTDVATEEVAAPETGADEAAANTAPEVPEADAQPAA